MVFSYSSLHAFVTVSINPLALISKEIYHSDFSKWKLFIDNEIQKLRLKVVENLFGSTTEAEKFRCIKSLQEQIVMLSDELNLYLYRERKVWSSHHDADKIKESYFSSLEKLEDFLSFLSKKFDRYYDSEVKITDFRLKTVVPQLRHNIHYLKQGLNNAAVDLVLIGIISNGLSKHIKNYKVSWANAKYISHFIHCIEQLDTVNNQTVNTVMLELDFNNPDYYLYNTLQISTKLLHIHGLHEQMELILQQKEKLSNININGYSLHTKQSKLKHDLITFYSEKIIFLEELMALRRVAMNDKYSSDQAFRISVGLTVPQLALFFRMQMEKGILVKEGVTEVFNFVAHHFYTEKAIFISAQNLLKRSTDVEFATVLKLWDVLVGMMEWLDENFSVKNYQRSLV